MFKILQSPDMTIDDRGDGRSTTRFVSANIIEADEHTLSRTLFGALKVVEGLEYRMIKQNLLLKPIVMVLQPYFWFTGGYEDKVMAQYGKC